MPLTHEALAHWFTLLETGDERTAREMLASSPALSECGMVLGDGLAYPPLHVAARHGAHDVLRLLLARGANPNEPARDAGAAAGFVFDLQPLQPRPFAPLDWAAEGGHEQAVALLLDAGADPDGVGLSRQFQNESCNADMYIGFPLSRALRSCTASRSSARTTSAYRIALRLLLAGANPNRAMTMNRWIGTPLAFAWRVLGRRALCTLLLHHGAELFTDDENSIRGAIRGGAAGESNTLAAFVIGGLLNPNRRYDWGVPLAPFAVYEDVSDDRRKLIRCFLDAGADPTLVFKHSLFKLHGFLPEYVKPFNLDALAAILNEVDDPDRAWPSGMTLWEAWETADATSLSKGSGLFDMARDPAVTRVGFDAATELQQDVAHKLCRSGYHAEGSWGYMKQVDERPGQSVDRGALSLVAQFQHGSDDLLRLWLRNKFGRRNKPYCVAEQQAPVAALNDEWVGLAEHDVLAAYFSE